MPSRRPRWPSARGSEANTSLRRSPKAISGREWRRSSARWLRLSPDFARFGSAQRGGWRNYSRNLPESRNIPRGGHMGQRASTTLIRSSSTSYGSRSLDMGTVTPPAAANGASEPELDFWSFRGIQKLCEKRLASKYAEILPNLIHVQRGAVCPQQRTNILKILRTP